MRCVSLGTHAKLIEQVKDTFNIAGEFDVPRQTIHNCIKTMNLEVWHSGERSPVIVIEVILISYIIIAWSLNCPLDVGACIAMMNEMIEDTVYEEMLIEWKVERKMYIPDAPLLGYAWFKGLKRRNPEIESKTGRKYPKNRSKHARDSAFSKMYNQWEHGLI